MNLYKGILKAALLAAAAAALLVGCTKQEEQDGTQAVEVALPSTEQSQIDLYTRIFESFIADYNKENGTSYTLKLSTGHTKDLINTRMSSNSRPDLVVLDSPADVAQYAKNGLLMDLTSHAAKDGWKDQLFNWAYELAEVDGKVYTLPYGYEGMVLWYNKEIMKELGLTAADLDTRAGFEGALEKAKTAGYTPIMLGSQDWPWAQEWYLSILYSYTGRNRLKSMIEGKESWEDPAVRDTVELYKSWNDKGYLADGKSYILTSDDAINAFTNDRALFKLEGTWATYWITPLDPEDKAKIGVMLHPAINEVEKPHLPLAVGCMWVVSADTEVPELSAYLMTRLLDKDIQGDFIREGLDVAPIAVGESAFEGLDPVVQEMWTLINSSLAEKSFGYTTWAFYPPETRVYAYEGIVNVLEENITVDDYLKEMQRLNTKELAGGFVPIVPRAE